MLIQPKVRSTLVFVQMFVFSWLCAQEKNPTYSSFAVNNKEVMWVQVYHAQQPADALAGRVQELLKRKPWISNLNFDGMDLIADIENFRVDYKRYGGKYMNTSNLIRTARWSGKTRISFKDGKYRVVVYGIEYDARQPGMHAGKMSNQPHMIHGTWTDWVLNRYRSDFRKSRHLNLDIMHFNLKDGFTLTETDLVDDDW